MKSAKVNALKRQHFILIFRVWPDSMGFLRLSWRFPFVSLSFQCSWFFHIGQYHIICKAKKKTNNWIVINIMSGIFMNGILYLLYELTRFGPHTPKPYIWISDELDVVVWNDLRICVVHHPLGCSVESSTICPGTWTRFEKYRTYHISCLIN
jgi:hypothetical protein